MYEVANTVANELLRMTAQLLTHEMRKAGVAAEEFTIQIQEIQWELGKKAKQPWNLPRWSKAGSQYWAKQRRVRWGKAARKRQRHRELSIFDKISTMSRKSRRV